MTNLPCQRHLFDMPREVAYLNAATRGPLPLRSAAAGAQALEACGRPWETGSEAFFEDSERARGLVARLLGLDAEGVAIIPSASYGLASVACNLRLGAGRRVLILRDQFPSNVYIWRRLAIEQGGEVVTVDAGPDGDLTAALLQQLDERVAFIAVPHCRWTDGALLDLVRMGQACRATGAKLVLDLTQSLGALPFEGADIRPDFVVCAGYKWLLGPYSLGWLWVAPEHRDGRPLEENWIGRRGSEDFSTLVDYQDGYQPGARRFDMGERSNFILLPIAMASLSQILEWGVDAIQRTLRQRTAAIAERAQAMGLESLPEGRRAGHYLALSFPRGMPAGLPERLAREAVHVSRRGDRLRVTPHVYNDEVDLDRLCSVLERVQ
jgi:selenocysteine lyase/cysteine desulfurase